jgi:hypothetical protein
VKSSVIISGKAINELYNLLGNYANNPDVYEIINNNTFTLFRVSLNYMITNEFSKLFDKGETKNSPKLSSICVLIDSLQKRYKVIDSILFDEKIIYDVKEYRDKTYAHSDKHELNKPLSVSVYSRDQLIRMNNNLLKVNFLLNKLSQNNNDNIFGEPKTYNLLRSFDVNTTVNFVKFSAIARKYYNDNSIDAMNKGYITQ